VPGGVSGRVSFRFYNPAAHTAAANVMHERLANEEFRQIQRIHRQFRALQPPYSRGWDTCGEPLIRGFP
jgi:hypothetical protein